MTVSDPYGLGRVLDPAGALPQAAERLDPSPPARPGEALVEVERLNLDAASFRQIQEEQGGDAAAMRERVGTIVGARGKMHNPATGSGGMLIGTVREAPGRDDLRPGDRIATLVSLTLTPLHIDDLRDWDGSSEQVPVRGHAILFPTAAFAHLPDDLPDRVSLAVLDVAGAPAQVMRLATAGAHVVVIGAAGKSGVLAMAAASELGGRVSGIVRSEDEANVLRGLGFDRAIVADARDAVATLRAVEEAVGPSDLTVSCVNVPGTEGASILATRDGGTVLFFSMATSFTSAALLAEGLGKDLTLLIGSGYVPGHAAIALDLVRRHPGIRELFDRRFGS